MGFTGFIGLHTPDKVLRVYCGEGEAFVSAVTLIGLHWTCTGLTVNYTELALRLTLTSVRRYDQVLAVAFIMASMASLSWFCVSGFCHHIINLNI